MIALRICGALERCPTFDRPLDLAAVLARQSLPDEASHLETWSAMRAEAERLGEDPELISALREITRSIDYLKLVRQFSRHSGEIIASARWHKSLPKFRTRLFDCLRDSDPRWLEEKVSKWLPAMREKAFLRLWSYDRRWFKRRYRRARVARLLERSFGKRGRKP